MAKATAIVEEKPGPITRSVDFVQEVKVEMNKVSWPTKDDLKASTQVVLILLAIFAVIIGVYDKVFQFVMLLFLRLGS